MSNERFLQNVNEARTCGYDLVCALCGCGMTDDDFEEEGAHDTGCPNEGRNRAAEMSEFLAKRLNVSDDD
jgi:hypothetical protein